MLRENVLKTARAYADNRIRVVEGELHLRGSELEKSREKAEAAIDNWAEGMEKAEKVIEDGERALQQLKIGKEEEPKNYRREGQVEKGDRPGVPEKLDSGS